MPEDGELDILRVRIGTEPEQPHQAPKDQHRDRL
jgi:hypothetical protein